ncbi:hypothetical protein CPB83DRAFT_890218 [Crepidotus variabilis]|uniref:Uncharacterized protein n=1 Tax=Crepidotus variabilis TaxID=179855 RepID=A0A9P6JV33_9AGAR|nr:hypothetical protein CPB83DRAFT_890218 [Crepidotus variabilis]
MSSVSKATTAHSGNTEKPLPDPHVHGANALPPSAVVEPTRVETPAQQGSTAPGDGHVVHDHHASHTNTSAGASEKLPFKEQVIAYAQKTRGTILGKPGLKEHGDAILDGQTTHEQDRKPRRQSTSN